MYYGRKDKLAKKLIVTLKMNIRITKNINEANCITHSGTFHADEIFATIILSKVKHEVILARVPEINEILNNKAIVYDIGGGKYDHHQFGGNGTHENGVKNAACGLIWKAYGKELLKKYNIEKIDDIWEYIDNNLIQFIDANDNGELPKLNIQYRNVHLSYMISIFNPRWNEETDTDESFMKALKFANVFFEEFMLDTIAKYEAKEMVDISIQNSKEGIMILEKNIPWKEFVLNSKNEKAQDINFVIFPSKRGGYNVYAVPIELGSFFNRKYFPKEWRGLRDNDLKQVTKIKSARFCHNNGFICSCEDKEDAIKLAKMANEDN